MMSCGCSPVPVLGPQVVAPEWKRNLCYYLYPIKDSYFEGVQIWKWNVRRLLRHLGIFNGRKLVNVSCDERTDSVESVIKEFGASQGIEISVVQNDKKLGEAAHFLGMLERVESLNPTECTFYAHGKGVSKPEYERVPVLSWASLMYDLNLGCIKAIDWLLHRYDAVGCLRWDWPPSKTQYIFCGTFFWFRHLALFSGNWRTIEQHRYGVENYLGQQISLNRSFSLTPAVRENLYKVPFKDEDVARWREYLSKLKELGTIDANRAPE